MPNKQVKTEVEQINEIKKEATIRVKTLVIALVWFASLVGMLMTGWFLHCSQQTAFEHAVQVEVEAQLKSSK